MVAVLHMVPEVAPRRLLVDGAAVEQGTRVNHIDLADLVGMHHDIVEDVVVRARRMIVGVDTGFV